MDELARRVAARTIADAVAALPPVDAAVDLLALLGSNAGGGGTFSSTD